MLAIITTAQEVVSALAYMHERDIIHGDVRGANIMLCSSTASPRGFTAQVRLDYCAGELNLGWVRSVHRLDQCVYWASA